MKVKVKAKEKDGVVKAKVLIKHAMETGRRKDKQGVIIPAHHVTEVKAEYKGETIFSAEFGAGVSKDPFVKFQFKGKAGDQISVTATDNKGQTGKSEAAIK